jgi:hypothetical protein
MIRQKLALNSGGMVVSSRFDCSRAPRISNTLRYLSVCLAKLRYLPLDLHHQSSSHMRNQTTETSFSSSNGACSELNTVIWLPQFPAFP